MITSPTAELLSPAGGWDCLRAAVANGADAVYFGLPRFNARMRADNFRDEELAEVVAFCHRHGVKAYVAFNTLVFTGELNDATEQLRLCNRAGVDALIVQDIGLVRLAAAITPELAIHASTQMTITSPEGAAMVQRELGIGRVVLARETSLRELEKFRGGPELEVFVHGALCVAYSGQCLTSESLGQRSANRGECAQACRMPYELIVDGAVRDLGDRRYLLSPQDLAAVGEIPALLARGVASFKIEGRLKTPEYVAAVTQVYRKAIDAALSLAAVPSPVDASDLYQLEMTFSRGLFTGWMHGVDHQRLAPARFGKKRGPFAGTIARVGGGWVEFEPQLALAPGDGIVFDTGGDTDDEQGGRIYEIRGRRFFFQHGRIDFARLHEGVRVWKTDDPALNKRLRQSFAGQITPRRRTRIDIAVSGRAGEPMIVECCGVCIESRLPLDAARTAPLGDAKLREHLGRFGDAPFELGTLRNELEGAVILPISELNRLRRELAAQLAATPPRPERAAAWRDVFSAAEIRNPKIEMRNAHLAVLCRSMEHIDAALDSAADAIYCDFEDVRRYADAVAHVRSRGKTPVLLATPRIQKAGEQGFFRLIENAAPDGVLIRNLGAIGHFAQRSDLELVGDFSLNVSNPLTAEFFMRRGLSRTTVSYDLTAGQVLDLLAAAPPAWFELTIHQHMPMFHMEHCVFAAFMSKGSTFLDCGRPCEKHRVHLRDRVGIEHPLRADVGCRNTLFNAAAQTGASFHDAFAAAGLRAWRVELLEEDAVESRRILGAYRDLLDGRRDGATLWRELRAQSQLGVTRGTLESRETARTA